MHRRLWLGVLLSVLTACGGKTGLALDVDGDAAAERDAAIEHDAALPVVCISECGAHAACVEGNCVCLPAYTGDGFTCLIAGQVAAGGDRSCAILQDGSVRCWGDNRSGALGDGTETMRLTGVEALGVRDAVQLSLGQFHACVRTVDRRVQCWGSNNLGQLGRGMLGGGSEPSFVIDINDAVDLAVGIVSSYARRATGRVSYWGSDALGTDAALHSTPTDLPELEGARELAFGYGHSCARWADARVSCWGENNHGQLGDGTTAYRSEPVFVAGLANAVEIEVGEQHSCARLSDGRVQCWGANAFRQSGDGVEYDGTNRPLPTFVWGLERVVEISAGRNHNCARLSDQTVRCWGDDQYGQIGPGGDGTQPRYAPTPVMGVDAAIGLALGSAHSCVAIADGTARCWGRNHLGQLGDGTTNNSVTPVTVIW